MKFFIPPNKNPEAEEIFWNKLNKDHNPSNYGKFTKRIYSITFEYNKNQRTETVDNKFSESGLIIAAIIETDDKFIVYTMSYNEHSDKWKFKHHPIHKGYAVEITYFE